MGGGRTNHQKCRGPGTQKAGLLKSPRMMTEARVKGGEWVEYNSVQWMGNGKIVGNSNKMGEGLCGLKEWISKELSFL